MRKGIDPADPGKAGSIPGAEDKAGGQKQCQNIDMIQFMDGILL